MRTGPTATPENHPEGIEVPPGRGKNLTLLGGSLLLARRNLRAGRGDQSGARRLAKASAFVLLIAGMLRVEHLSNPIQEVLLLSSLLAQALAGGGGTNMVKLKVAESLKGKQIVFLPAGSGMDVRTTDVNALLQRYGVEDVAGGD